MSRPLGSTATPASSGFAATTGRSAGDRRIGTQCLRFPPFGTLPLATRRASPTGTPYRRSPSHVPHESRRSGSRRLYAGHHLASQRAPARLIPRGKLTLGFDAISSVSTPQRRHPARTQPSALERLPDPHLTRSRRAFSLDAHHDGLQPTQHQGGLAPAPEDRRWRASNPPSLAQHRLCEGTSTRLLLRRS